MLALKRVRLSKLCVCCQPICDDDTGESRRQAERVGDIGRGRRTRVAERRAASSGIGNCCRISRSHSRAADEDIIKLRLDVVINDDVILANDPNAAGTVLVTAKEKVPVYDATVAMAQREHPGAFQKRIRAISVLARLVRDDFQFTITALEQVVFHERA